MAAPADGVTVHRFSRRVIEHLARPLAAFTLGRSERSTKLPARAAALEAALLDASGGRGMPTIAEWKLGCDSTCPECLIAHHRIAGNAYLGGDGHVLRGGGAMIAADPYTFVERLVLLEQFAMPARARCRRMPRSVKRAPEASDGWVDCWLDEGLLYLVHDADMEVRCSSLKALSSFLAWASSQREEVHIDSIGDYEVRSDRAPAVEPVSAVYDVTRRSRYTVVAADDAVIEERARHGRALTTFEIRGNAATARIREPASRALGGRVSPRVERYADAAGIVRVPEETIAFDALARELDRRRLPFFDSWFAFEEAFGGLSWEACEPYWEAEPPRLGLSRFLSSPPGELEDGDEGSRFLEDAAFPAAKIGDDLVLRVAFNPPGADRWLMDERGRIHSLCIRHTPEAERIDRLRLEADSATTALERIALRWEVRTALPGAAPIILDVCIGEQLAAEVGASIVAEASDAACLIHRIEDDLWIESRPAGPRTTLLGRDPARVAEVVRVGRSLSSRASVRVREDLPGGPELCDALAAIGIDPER